MEPDRSLRQKAQATAVTGGGSGRSKLSLRLKKDKDPPVQQHSSPPRNPTNLSLRITPVDTLTAITPKASKTTSTTNDRENDRDHDTGAHDKAVPMEILKHDNTNDDVEFVPLDKEREEKGEDERTELELRCHVSSPSPTADSDDDGGLGDFFFCHICQKDLTRFNESRRQTHINRCCDKQEEEKESLAATAKKGQSSVFACLLCEKSFKSDNARITHMKSCAKSNGVAPDRLVHLMRESKTTSPATVDSTASSGMLESSSSSRLEGEGEGERKEPLQTRRSKRLIGQRREGRKQDKKSEVITVATGEEDDFAMPPPVSRPAGRRGRKRKRDNFQENYLEQIEGEELRLAIALSASMEGGCSAAPMYGGGEISDADQGKGRKRQKRKNTAAEVVPPLLTVTTEQAESIISQRAEEILRHSETANDNGALEEGDNYIPCTPAFQESELGGGDGYRPAPPMKPGTTEGGHDDKDDDEVLLLEEKDEEQLELDDDTAAKQAGDVCLADGNSSPKSTDEGLSTNEGKETGPVQPDNVTKSGEKLEDDEAMSLGDESEHSEFGGIPLPAETDATEHGASFHKDLQDVDYPTLWQLTSEETENNEHFYVPALVPVVSPIKVEQTRCKFCQVEPCLALTLQAVPTIPTESQYWKEKLNTSPLPEQTTDSSQVNCDDSAINQLLSDLGGLVGSSLLSDVQIQTGSGSIIPAHAVILAARCHKIREVIEQSQTTPFSLDFSEFDEDSILAFLRFIYIGSSPTVTEDDAELRHNFSILLERWYSDKDDERNDVIIENRDNSDSSALARIERSPTSDLKSEAKHAEIKISEDVHCMDFSSRTEELSPVRNVGDSDDLSDHLRRHCLTSNGSSPELERDCSLRVRREHEGHDEIIVRRRSSSEWSHPNSHISLSSVDSNEVVICKTPTTLLSPGERREKDFSSSSDLFLTSPSRAENDHISEDEREDETGYGDAMKEENERTVESIVVESSNSSSRNSSVLSLASPKSSHKQEVNTSSDNSLPDVSLPNVSTPEISIPKVSIPDVSSPNITVPDFSIADYSPINDYSFGAFDDDVVSYPSPSFEQEPVEPAPLKLVTPVNNRTVTVVPESIDTMKRKPQCFKTPANCGVELQTDDDITPMPDFKSMRTPCLKGECARFGVKALSKKKMIAKLSEIYEYTHPLVDAEGRIVSVDNESLEDGDNAKTTKQRPADKTKTRAGRTKKMGTTIAAADGGRKTATQACSVDELKMAVLEYFKSDKQLYQDILLFKPMELTYFCTKVKSAGISVTKETLADILDNLCITYTVPRRQRTGKKTERVS